jgi:hypothetical protein
MKILKALGFVVVFLLVGEIIVRIDDAFRPFEDDQHGAVAIAVNNTYEWQLLKDNKVPQDDSTLRVLVLGDSYIHGVGMDPSLALPQLLKAKLTDTSGKYKRYLVLDATMPANNALDNYRMYRAVDIRFKPQLVVLAYNLNDVMDNLDEDTSKNASIAEVTKEHPGVFNVRTKLISLLIHSHLVYFAVHQVKLEAKLAGYPLPGSDLDMEMKSYTQHQTNWIKTQKIMSKLMDSTQDRKEELLVMMVPIYNLLKNSTLFKATDSTIYHFFADSSRPNTVVWNTRSFFTGMLPSTLCLNKYEEHPSPKVHEMEADSVRKFISEKFLGGR